MTARANRWLPRVHDWWRANARFAAGKALRVSWRFNVGAKGIASRPVSARAFCFRFVRALPFVIDSVWYTCADLKEPELRLREFALLWRRHQTPIQGEGEVPGG